MSNEITFRLNSGFPVSEFMKNIQIDFLYSYSNVTKEYKLLNNDAFGTIESSVVRDLKKSRRVVVIEIPNNLMKAYNIPEDELIEAFTNMGRFNGK
ncbi:TPA: hypothetical protein ACGO1T_001825 [Streptococcus suis]